MLDEVVKHFPDYAKDEEEDERPKVAIIGKPNVGKSSLINKDIFFSVVSNVGINRIACCSRNIGDDHTVLLRQLIDTAGLRRKKRLRKRLSATASSVR